MIWTRPLLEQLKKDLAAAVKTKAEVFTFEGHALLPAYARYLVEYLESVLKKSESTDDDGNHEAAVLRSFTSPR